MVQEVIAPALQRTISNALITVLHVEVSKDLSTAKIRYSVIGLTPLAVAQFLEEETPALRTKLAKTLRTKRIPRLVFEFIESQQVGIGK